ncbi:MAG TPA: chromate efflux transporter [Gemmatimonadaceae bacterium]|nr:chromate efflux transporter [Gemmatimonadaceae bacterium]
MTDDRVRQRATLGDLARLFLKLGTIGVGGPAAHIALMEDEVVRRRGWLTREAFLDYLGATNLIPGPNSTELAIEIGRDRAGWPGLIVAGVAFIVPATLIVGITAWAYVRFGNLPAALALFAGVKPVIIAIVVQALWRLARTAVKTRWLGVLTVAAMVAVAAGVHELVVLVAAGILSVVGTVARPRAAGDPASTVTPIVTPLVASTPKLAGALGGVAGVPVAVSLWSLFAVFLKIGAVLFGSGYVLLAFLRADFVERLGWLTERQLLDAVAVGQVTPGPVFTTATFIGYVLGGIPGAVLATVGIFLPAFVFVAVSGPLVPRLRRSRLAGAALDGVNAGSLGLMAVVTWQLGRASIVSVSSCALAVIAGALLATRRVNAAWLVVGGAIAGLALGM